MIINNASILFRGYMPGAINCNYLAPNGVSIWVQQCATDLCNAVAVSGSVTSAGTNSVIAMQKCYFGGSVQECAGVL